MRLFSLYDDMQRIIFSNVEPSITRLSDQPKEGEIENVLTLSCYHLIEDGDEANKTYKVGFCQELKKGKKKYVTKSLNEKTSAVVRLMHEHPTLFEGNVVRNRLVIKTLEQEVKAMGGVTLLRLQQFKQLARICKDTRNYAFHSLLLKKELFQDYLHHVAYGEQEEAEAILTLFPEFLLSDWRANILGCNLNTEFLDVTGFELAVRQGDWFMWKMMLGVVREHIPVEEQESYFADLQKQFETLRDNEYRLPCQIDLLKRNGLQVLQGAPSRAQEVDTVKRNAFHLIVEREVNGEPESRILGGALGLCDSETNEYRLYPLREDSDLYQFVTAPENKDFFYPKPLPWNQDERYLHRILRDKEILELARDEIHRLGGITQIEDHATLDEEVENLQTHLQEYIRKIEEGVSNDVLREYWCGIIGSDQQQLSAANLWQWYLSQEIDWRKIDSLNFSKFSSRPFVCVDWMDRLVLPTSLSLGGDFVYLRCGVRTGRGAADMLVDWRRLGGAKAYASFFLETFCQVKTENCQTLADDLNVEILRIVNRPS